MKIYTKTGDQGQTSLYNGSRVNKMSNVCCVLGQIDELSCRVGLLISSISELKDESVTICRKIQCTLQDLGAYVGKASEPVDSDMNLTDELENEIDRMTRALPSLTKFVLPGGTEASSRAHLCRVMARTVEREYVALVMDSDDYTTGNLTFPYLNRLSDYFFTLARHLTIGSEAFYEEYQ